MRKKEYTSPSTFFRGILKPVVSIDTKKKNKVIEKSDWLFDFLRDLTEKNGMILNGDNMSFYSPVLINKWLSCSASTILYAQQVNLIPTIFADKLAHYKLLYSLIPKGKVYFNWQKKSENLQDDTIELISKYYNISKREAQNYLIFISDDDVSRLKEECYEGGPK